MKIQKYTVLLAALLVTPAAALSAAATATLPRPNILHIHADDHRADGLHALGTELLQTPNLDTLVEHGMTFTRCYTMGSMVGAVCTPSRTMMLTGRSWQRIPGAPAAPPEANDPATWLPRLISAAGYQTWHMGKYGNGFPAGLKEFETSIQDDARGKSPENDRSHCTRRLADRSIGFLRERTAAGKTKPFYIYLAPPVPHDPRLAEARFHQIYSPSSITLSPAFLPQHPFDNGEMTVRDEALAPWPRTPEDTRQQTADYYAAITGLDYHMGRVFAELKAGGQWENTIVIFSGDNGLSLGEHGLFGKQNLYEFGGMHVPLVIAGPGIVKGRSDTFVYLLDLFRTLADFAGATVRESAEGENLRPVLEGKAAKIRDVLYTGYRDGQRSIRNDRWKLIRYPLVDRTQLFDLSVDPHELNNLAGLPGHTAKVSEMTALLLEEMNRYADNCPLKVANPKPAEWTPPAAGKRQAGQKKKRPGRETPFGADGVALPAGARTAISRFTSQEAVHQHQLPMKHLIAFAAVLHDRRAKHSNVENDVRSALIISVPGMKAVSRKKDALVEFVDMYPTLAEVAGLPLPGSLEGTSFKPLLDHPGHPWKSAAFSQYPRTVKGRKLMGYSMRTNRYRFTRWVDRDDSAAVDAVELYDHQTDPQENTNIAEDPANKALVGTLTAQWSAGWKGALVR